MPVNLNFQASVIDIKNDIPQKQDIFIVDTNVWFWETYNDAAFSIRSRDRYKLIDYSNYLIQAFENEATLAYSGLTHSRASSYY